jgi:hypothetical protein
MTGSSIFVDTNVDAYEFFRRPEPMRGCAAIYARFAANEELNIQAMEEHLDGNLRRLGVPHRT